MKIGVFDSGIGGITVLHALLKELPGHAFVYYGDNANLPYGTKSPEQIQRLCRAAATALQAKAIDHLVVACNTASSYALDEIRSALGPEVPVLGVVEPGAEAALAAPTRGTILVLATKATVASGAYPAAVAALGGERSRVIQQACPLLVPMIEENWVEHPILKAVLKEYLLPHRAVHAPGVILLGCTHYPWIQPAIEAVMPGWWVVSSAHAVAERLKRSARAESPSSQRQSVEWIFTDPSAVPPFARQWTPDFRSPPRRVS